MVSFSATRDFYLLQNKSTEAAVAEDDYLG